jgi:hypothetical protein
MTERYGKSFELVVDAADRLCGNLPIASTEQFETQCEPLRKRPENRVCACKRIRSWFQRVAAENVAVQWLAVSDQQYVDSSLRPQSLHIFGMHAVHCVGHLRASHNAFRE